MKKNIFLIIDFDSTIISCETLDELSNISLKNDFEQINQIKNITNKAMDGDIDFIQALNNRLNILNIILVAAISIVPIFPIITKKRVNPI